MFLCPLDNFSKAHFLSINCYNRQLQSLLLSLVCVAATQSLLSTQGLHPLHLCAEQNRSDLHRGARHHLQGAALCAHLSSPPLELRWPAGEDLGLPEACAHVRFTFPLSRCQTEGKWSEVKFGFKMLAEFHWDLISACSYTKPKGQLPDYTSPVVLPDGRTAVEDFCLKIHKNLIKELK